MLGKKRLDPLWQMNQIPYALPLKERSEMEQQVRVRPETASGVSLVGKVEEESVNVCLQPGSLGAVECLRGRINMIERSLLLSIEARPPGEVMVACRVNL